MNLDSDSTKPKKIWEQIKKHVAPKLNHRLARYQPQQLRQKNKESIADFMIHYPNQATRCKLRDVAEADERLIEQLIIGTKHKNV